jgi:hypothetical protein
VRRHPEDKVVHQLVREHLESFLAEARAQPSAKKMKNGKPETADWKWTMERRRAFR